MTNCLTTDNNQNYNLILKEYNNKNKESSNYKEESKNTIATMFNNLQKKEKEDNELFESKIIDNEDEINSIESKISTRLFRDDNFMRENPISARYCGDSKKIMKDEISILKEAKKEQESKIKETEEELQKEQIMRETKIQEQLNNVNNYYNDCSKVGKDKKYRVISKKGRIIIFSFAVFLFMSLLLIFFLFI